MYRERQLHRSGQEFNLSAYSLHVFRDKLFQASIGIEIAVATPA